MPAARPEVRIENWLIVGWLAAASTVSVNSWVWTMPPASIAVTSMTAVPLAWAAGLTVIRRLPSMSLGPNATNCCSNRRSPARRPWSASG